MDTKETRSQKSTRYPETDKKQRTRKTKIIPHGETETRSGEIKKTIERTQRRGGQQMLTPEERQKQMGDWIMEQEKARLKQERQHWKNNKKILKKATDQYKAGTLTQQKKKLGMA